MAVYKIKTQEISRFFFASNEKKSHLIACDSAYRLITWAGYVLSYSG